MSMSGLLSRLSAHTSARGLLPLARQATRKPSSQALFVQPVRSVVYTDTGAVLDRPEQVKFGLIKTLLVVLPFIYLGATISKSGAAFLEENDIFVPQEDDD